MSAKPNGKPKSKKTQKVAAREVRLQTNNPFDLIRLIAYSQSDPRKAMAEFVQNSLDAGAREIVVSRFRRRGEVYLTVLDDGQGVFPELDRASALERIATNVGHSFKRNLSLAERQKQMLLGKYGIGLLGFWCIGQELEIRSRVAGSDVWALRLTRDQPKAEILPLKQPRIPFPGDTWTEMVIRQVHPGPSRQLSGRRLGEYFAAELRGQLLARATQLRVTDRLARTAGVKNFLVVPQRFEGRPLDQFGELMVPGFPAARLELYLLDPEVERAGKLSLTCGGTVVCEELAAVDGYDLDPAVWGWQRLQGVVEFPALEVAPSTRRGFVPGVAADALFAALRAFEPDLRAIVAAEDERQKQEQDTTVAKEIRSAFRPLVQSLPQYDFFQIRSTASAPPGSANVAGQVNRHAARGADLGAAAQAVVGAQSAAPFATVESEAVTSPEIAESPTSLFGAGPLQTVVIAPAKSRVLPGASRPLVAKAYDADRQRISTDISFRWEIADGNGELTSHDDRANLIAGLVLGMVKIQVWARQGEREVQADAEVEVVSKLSGENPDAGIPDPERVFDPNGDWRSRLANGRWEYNAAHPDYRAVADDARQRLRYFVHLFTKEIVLYNYGEPKDERLLERVIEVLTHIRTRP